MLLRRRLSRLLAAAMLLAALMLVAAPPALAAHNAGKSLDNRNERSLRLNFGHCHQSPFPEFLGAFFGVSGSSELRVFNPNPNNSGHAACRHVGNLVLVSVS